MMAPPAKMKLLITNKMAIISTGRTSKSLKEGGIIDFTSSAIAGFYNHAMSTGIAYKKKVESQLLLSALILKLSKVKKKWSIDNVRHRIRKLQ